METEDSNQWQTEDLDEWETDENAYEGISQSDFSCGVCYELMILPTTLKCGHNFCRPCLAQWYSTSKKTECPVCRQVYNEKPAVNTLVRGIIEKSFKEKVEERSAILLTSATKKVIADYDKAVTNQQGGVKNLQFNWNRNRNRNGADFCSGFLFMLGIVVILYLVWYWRNMDDGLLIKKNVIQWTSDDVHTWLTDLGVWTEPYRETFLNNTVDGRLLLALDENGLESILHVTKKLHQAAILAAIESLKDTGMKPPSTIWEYKALHPGYALFLLYGIKDYPRITLLYLYWFDYYNMFLPFVHYTCPLIQEDEYITNNTYEPLSRSQEIEFSTKLVFTPYVLVAQFTYTQYITIHYWTSRFVMVNCLVLTLIEAAGVRWLIMSRGWRLREVIPVLKSHGKGLAGMIICIVLWPVIPNFICDFVFYIALYFSPYTNCEKLYKIWKGRE